MARPLLLVIGPSASGKSAVVRRLHGCGVVRVHPTWTTRPPRAAEAGGALEHRFVSEREFDERTAGGFFLGTVQLPGLPFRYGLPAVERRDDGPIDTVMARAPFVPAFDEFFDNRIVYQIEGTLDDARARLRERGSDAAEIAARLAVYDDEIAAGRALADRVFANDTTLDELVGRVVAALDRDVRIGAAA
jgi:guanylate kinase